MNKAYIFSLFLLFTAIGTLLHELGHFFAAIWLGCKPVLHYNRTNFMCGENNSETFRGLSGPFVNILIGTIGLLWLLKKYKTGKQKQIILLAAITFFWSREIVVLCSDVFIKPTLGLAAYLSDEQKASLALNLPLNTLSIAVGIAGLFVCGATIFKLLNKQLRISFIAFGALGALAGYFVWFKLLGPYLLP